MERRASVLVVDDDASVLDLIEHVLESQTNFYVQGVGSADEALGQVSDSYWDTVVLDLNIPKTESAQPDTETGFEVLERIVEHNSFMSVIVMTGYNKPEHTLRALEIGAFYYLAKPFYTQYLTAIVKNAVKVRSAYVDGLTGLLNRTAFDERLRSEFEKTRRILQAYDFPAAQVGDEHCLSLIFLDLDNFKQVNDQCGHQVGDKVLRKVASFLHSDHIYNSQRIPSQRIIRPYDVACRYGGDEFAVFLPNTNHKNALRIARRIHRMVEPSKFDEVFSESECHIHIGISSGIVSYPFPNRIESHIELTELADAFMYKSKRRSRDLMCYQDMSGEMFYEEVN